MCEELSENQVWIDLNSDSLNFWRMRDMDLNSKSFVLILDRLKSVCTTIGRDSVAHVIQ
jgi:hypothetical protein